jgi:hypothetical protein
VWFGKPWTAAGSDPEKETDRGQRGSIQGYVYCRVHFAPTVAPFRELLPNREEVGGKKNAHTERGHEGSGDGK